MTNLQEAVDTVKRAMRAGAVHICWPAPGVMDAIKEQEAAKGALSELPALTAASHPFYQSVEDGQSGFILEAHLADDQLPALPLHIVTEMLDELTTIATGVNNESPPQYRRSQLLAAYGPELADLICQGIDEALESRSEGHKRLTDWDGSRHAPLSSTEIDEPHYEDCSPDEEHASPATSFDFYHAIEGARELIEARDKAAADARRGIQQPA